MATPLVGYLLVAALLFAIGLGVVTVIVRKRARQSPSDIDTGDDW